MGRPSCEWRLRRLPVGVVLAAARDRHV